MTGFEQTAIVDSPCVRNCCLNDEDVCLGCGRTLAEITRWSAALDTDKKIILANAAHRRAIIKLRHSL